MKFTSTSRIGWFGTLAFLWALLVLHGCSRPDIIPADPSTSQAQAEGTAAELAPAVESSPKLQTSYSTPPSTSVQDSGNLPAGTLLTVRLKSAVYAGIAPSDGSFEGIVVAPIIVAGTTMIPKGASVAGRVESAQTSSLKPNRGYVRLVLNSVQLGNHYVPVQTDSLFAREAPMGSHPISAIHLEKGRRLTFRLAETSFASDQRPRLTP